MIVWSQYRFAEADEAACGGNDIEYPPRIGNCRLSPSQILSVYG